MHKQSNHGPGRPRTAGEATTGVATPDAGVQATDTAASEKRMPTIQLGRHTVSRLIVGANPILGFSYMGGLMARFMLDYFTPDRILDLLVRCLDVGINTWQTSPHEKVDQALTALRESGRDVHWILLASGDYLDDNGLLEEAIARHHPIAVVHHGGVTDRLWREGRIGEVCDFTKRVRDLGVLAGISAHNPDVIRHAEDRGWDLDLYMTCFYQLTRTQEELSERLGGEVPLWGTFLPGDPGRMCEVVRAVKRPCLAFKILAGGRRAERPDDLEAAFAFAFSHIKPSDAVIVGMFPRFRDEPAEDAALVRRFGATDA